MTGLLQKAGTKSFTKGCNKMILKIIFPLLMVIGALGSLIVEIINKGDWKVGLQWIGACLLYTALMFRNAR